MRIIKRILHGILAIALLLVLWPFVVDPAMWHWRVRQESVAILSAAESPSDLQQAVGSLGIFIPLHDGSWIAIRYRDTHAGRLYSLAIARDSGGNWYKSTYHFCGSFNIYRIERKWQEDDQLERAESGETGPSPAIRSKGSETLATLDAVFSAPSLESGRRQLLKLGFKPFTR